MLRTAGTGAHGTTLVKVQATPYTTPAWTPTPRKNSLTSLRGHFLRMLGSVRARFAQSSVSPSYAVGCKKCALIYHL